MGYTFVQVTELRASTGSSVSGPVTSTAGNALFCCANAFTGNSTTPTVSGGGTWTSDASGHNATANTVNSISSCPSATGGTQTITVSTSSNNNGGVAFVYEFSGNPTSSIRDATSPAAATGTGTTATTNSLSNVTANAVFMATAIDDDGTNPTTMTGTSTGWSYPSGGQELNASTYSAAGSGYDIVSATGSQTSAWTVKSSHWMATIAVYKAPTGGGGSPQQQLTLLGVGSRTLRTPRPEVYRSRRARRHAVITQPFGVDRLISVPNTIRGKSLINI